MDPSNHPEYTDLTDHKIDLKEYHRLKQAYLSHRHLAEFKYSETPPISWNTLYLYYVLQYVAEHFGVDQNFWKDPKLKPLAPAN